MSTAVEKIKRKVQFKEESYPKSNEVCFESRSKGIIIISGSLLTFGINSPNSASHISTLKGSQRGLSLGRSETLKFVTSTRGLG